MKEQHSKIKWKNAWRHFRTITAHRHMVIRHCARAGILWQGLRHDLSKYSPTEFLAGARYYQGNRSPNEGEREAYGYSYAWMHHKGRNKHHFEYWTDYTSRTRTMSPVRMPVRYVKEMVCDRMAASKIYQKEKYTDASSIEYFMRAKGRRVIHPDTSNLLEHILRMLAEKGEDETFAYLRGLKEYPADIPDYLHETDL